MKCLNSACSCHTINGDYCSDLCAAMALRGPVGACVCGHVGCDATAKRPRNEFAFGRRRAADGQPQTRGAA